MREIGEENVHRAQIYLTARLHTCLSCVIFVCIISRRDGENIGIAGVPLLPSSSRAVSRPNSLPLSFRTSATQATRDFKIQFVPLKLCPCSQLASAKYNDTGIKFIIIIIIKDADVKETIGLISKTTTSHVHHVFLYISFPLLHDYDVKMPNFVFYGERNQATAKFYFSF